jgi:Flp pilus assembly protein TadD
MASRHKHFARFALIPFVVLASTFCSAGQDWIEIKSTNFSVVTDAGDKRGREVAERFEQMRAIFGSIFSKERVNIPVPLQIIAFRNSKEMRDFAPLWHGKPIELAGLYQKGEDRNFILLDLSSPNPYQTTFHEYGHLLLNGNFPPSGPWFDEGFAEFFSSIQIIGKQVELGQPPEFETEMLRAGAFTPSNMMPVPALFSVTKKSPVYNESGDHRSMFYAESWLFVHYIFDRRLFPQTMKYFDLVNKQGASMAQAMQTAYGMDAKQMQQAFLDYFRKGKIAISEYPAPAMTGITYSAQELKAPDAHAILADAHFHNVDHQQQAIEEFQQVLKEDPNNEAAERGLGYAYLYRHDFANAAAHFRHAIDLNSQDPRVLMYVAMLELQHAQFGGSAPDYSALKQQLEKCITLDPTLGDAYGMLGYVELRLGAKQDALTTFAEGLKIKPRDEHMLLNYAEALASAQKFDDASAIFEHLKGSDDAFVASQAEMALDHIAQMKQATANGAHVIEAPEPSEQP